MASAKQPGSINATTAPPADLSILIASDTHLGFDEATRQRNVKMMERMNHLEGSRLPDGSLLPKPQGLFITGDLTEDGGADQWRVFERVYLAKAAMPVFENFGNHDHHRDGYVQDRIQARHGDTNYAVDLGGVRCISLGEAPDARGLAFLKQNLQTGPSAKPVLLFFHLPLLGPWAENNWFTGAAPGGSLREQLAHILKGHRVIGIFQGHYHASSTYRWKGIDVYEVGSVKDHWRSFFALRIQGPRMTVASWNLDLGDWWWFHQKDWTKEGEETLKRLPAKPPKTKFIKAKPRLREW